MQGSYIATRFRGPNQQRLLSRRKKSSGTRSRSAWSGSHCDGDGVQTKLSKCIIGLTVYVRWQLAPSRNTLLHPRLHLATTQRPAVHVTPPRAAPGKVSQSTPGPAVAQPPHEFISVMMSTVPLSMSSIDILAGLTAFVALAIVFQARDGTPRFSLWTVGVVELSDQVLRHRVALFPGRSGGGSTVGQRRQAELLHLTRS